MLVSVASAATMLVAVPVFAQSSTPPNSAGSSGGGGVGPAGRAVRISVGPIGPSSLSADLKTKLEDAAAAGLVASGATVVPAADLARARGTAGLGSCADSACERRLAGLTDTHYWMRGAVLVDGSTYRMHLELVDTQTGSVAAARDDTCDICTEADAAELANVAASALKASLTHAQIAPPPASIPAKPASASTHGVALTAPIDQQSVPPETTLPAWRRGLAWVAFGGAVAAAAGGVYYVYQSGRETDCEEIPVKQCYRFNGHTVPLGVALIGVGAVLATSGVLLLALPAGKTDSVAPSPPRLVISLGSVAIAGSF